MWNFPLFPERASSMAGRVDLLFAYELAIVLFFTFAVCLLFIVLAIRYRRGTRVDRSNPLTSSRTLEAIWIGVPLALVLSMFVWATILFFEMYTPPGDAYRIYVVGKQWMWKLQHPEGKKEINELHVPLGRPVKLRMTSQDVIHSFYIPAFRIKQDVLPGRYTELWFEPTRVGDYHLFCAEYCGTYHSGMRGTVHVMDPADYERWLSRSAVSPSMAKEGEALFVRHYCAGCHRGSQMVQAPRLEGVYGRPVPIMDPKSKEVSFVTADDRYIRDSILLPKSQVVAGYEPVMPSFEGQIGEEDLLKIIEYIKSIGPGGAER
jgi:cytochrome c oxidase subunit II